MNFLNPIALLFSLLSAFIIIMYLLKLRRKKEKFSSTLLWVKSVEDLTANAPFQKLRQNPLMYLQLLLLLLLVLALARPTMWLSRTRGLSRVILMDNSASMNATDGGEGRSRLDEAKAKARELVQNMAPGDRTMIVSYGAAARVVQPMTSEKAILASALRRIEPTDSRARIKEAVLMAKGVLKSDKNSLITIIGDGGEGYLGNLLGEDDPVEFVSVGASDDNCGIVAFDLRESFEQAGRIQVFAEVENYSSEPREILLRCIVNGEVLQAREETIEAKSRKGYVFSGLEGGEEAEGDTKRFLRLEIDRPDLLEADNVVQGYINLDNEIEILLVSNGNFYLEKILGLLPGTRVAKIAPDKYEPAMNTDLVIFDQFAPERVGPGRYLFINVVPPFEGFSAEPEPIENQIMLDWNRIHPVTRFLNLGSLAFTETLDLSYPAWAISLAESAEGPMLLTGERKNVKLVAVAFDLYDTDWPMQISFPVFLNNTVRWLAGEIQGSLSGNHLTGETITLLTENEITIIDPEGREWVRQPDESQLAYFSETYRVGIYRTERKTAEGETETEHFAVNLLSIRESDITPKKEIVTGEKIVVASTVSKENREVWIWFVIVGLLVLTAEWHLYCRRAWL